jgi:hypothetical protein
MQASRGWTGWVDLIPPNQWSVYRRLPQDAIARRIPFALGGTFATATHTGYWRDTGPGKASKGERGSTRILLYTVSERGKREPRNIDFIGHPNDEARLVPPRPAS